MNLVIFITCFWYLIFHGKMLPGPNSSILKNSFSAKEIKKGLSTVFFSDFLRCRELCILFFFFTVFCHLTVKVITRFIFKYVYPFNSYFSPNFLFSLCLDSEYILPRYPTYLFDQDINSDQCLDKG